MTITKNVEATFIPSSEPAISTSSEWTAMPAGNANLKKALMERNSEILALKENLHKLALQKEVQSKYEIRINLIKDIVIFRSWRKAWQNVNPSILHWF